MPSSRATKKPPPKEAAAGARKKRGNATANQTSKVITRSTAKLPTANTGHNNISGHNLLDDIEEQNLDIEEQKSDGEESHNQPDKPVNSVILEQTAQELATDTVQAGKQDAAGPPKKKLRLGQTRETLPYRGMYLACPSPNCERVQYVPNDATGKKNVPKCIRESQNGSGPRQEIKLQLDKLILEPPAGVNQTQQINMFCDQIESGIQVTNTFKNFKRNHIIECFSGCKTASEMTEAKRSSLPPLYRDHRRNVLSAAEIKEKKRQKKLNDQIMLHRLKRIAKFIVDPRNFDSYMGLEVSEIFPYNKEEVMEAIGHFSP